jgi:hypothetical protein
MVEEVGRLRVAAMDKSIQFSDELSNSLEDNVPPDAVKGIPKIQFNHRMIRRELT